MDQIRDIMTLAWTLYRAGDLPGAEQVYREATRIEPKAAEAWYLLGTMCQVRRKQDEAAEHYRRALALDPDHADARNNLGVILLNRRETAEAADCFREVLRLRPDHADARSNLGNAIQALGQLDEAVLCYRRAIEIKPDHADAHNGLGNALRNLGRLPEAIASYEDAARIAPDHPQVRLCRALAWLQAGDFDRGWIEHEWRFKCPGSELPALPRPCWDGSPLEGRPILLYADHGLGDALHFIRYARLVEGRGGRAIVACRQPLARILATAPGVWRVAPEGEPVWEFDVYAPLMSLPRIFGTTVETIPADVPYLVPDAPLVAKWRDELGSGDPGGGFKVGVAWQGNPGHGSDRERSFRLAQLEPLARVPGVRLFSLQKGAGSEQISGLDGRFAVIDLGDRLDDLMDTAALMRSLDLVVTPDTSLAHLAGAIGARAWVALPFASDWRWLTGRDDSPWYPTLRLFRQPRWGAWDDVFGRMASELSGTLAQRSSSQQPMRSGPWLAGRGSVSSSDGGLA